MKLTNDVETAQEIKKSRFICYLHPCSTEEQARDFIKDIKKLHPSARHHCTAIKIGSLMRSSDDGEPSGTAGRPMLDVLANSEADQLCAVVVRYFGGTLLGKGGLVRAYSSSVAQALEQAVLASEEEYGLWQLEYDYSEIAKVEAWMRSSQIEAVETDYQSMVLMRFLSLEDPTEEIARISSGKLKPQFLQNVMKSNILSHN
ncbi:MAG: YigZ family protein [Erysipelotrichaceae bacterium]|nr:YigZ family protein [Erysipelotrichaceae bacterium]